MSLVLESCVLNTFISWLWLWACLFRFACLLITISIHCLLVQYFDMVVHVYDGFLVIYIYTLCMYRPFDCRELLSYIDLFYFNLIVTFTHTIPGTFSFDKINYLDLYRIILDLNSWFSYFVIDSLLALDQIHVYMYM